MVFVIGINEDGIDGLSERAKKLIKEADVIFGGKRHIELVKSIIGIKETIFIGADIQSVLDEITKRHLKGKMVVVLNSGDPLFYGLAKKIVERIGKDSVEIIPNLSSVQLAFSKIKENWEDAKILSIHSKAKEIDDFLDDIRESEKILFLTAGKEDPKKIAKFLKDKNIKVKKFFVLENLGGKNEKVYDLDIDEVEKHEFSPLNIVIILKERNSRRFDFGLPESEFEHIGGLITKSEIRAIVLSKLKIDEDAIIWDIGGGSGSVSVECALLARKGKVYCIEKRENMVEIIKRNIQKFSLKNVEVIFGEAPEALKNLPSPSSVFIGGGGEKIDGILSECISREPRNIVCTFADVSHLVKAMEFCENIRYEKDILFLSVMKLKKIEKYSRFDTTTNVFLLHLKNTEIHRFS